MTLEPGARVGSYQILKSLGKGGMGEVYRARDSKLQRDVAIKILPELWLSDPERRARFDREARVLASLNHPHVGAIYGVEEGSGVRALVLELIEGATLADRLANGRLAVGQALAVARQIAGALEAAHQRGVIHRDLKPANVMLVDGAAGAGARTAPRRDSLASSEELSVKVVDFGLAKEVAPRDLAAATDSPTLALDATIEGRLLGTAAYMSPEQARGEEVDQRTDVWALGCVLFEMLTGRAPFAGASLPDTLAAVVSREPDWRSLPAGVPAGARRLLQRCLEKDWRRRLHDVGDARILLEDAMEEPGATDAAVAPPPRASMGGRAAVAVAALVIAGAAGWLLRGAIGRGSAASAAGGVGPSELRLEISTPPTNDPVSLAISPDGRTLAFVASIDGKSLLWVRPLDGAAARPLPGTAGAAFPFWSPDSRAIGFFADGQLKRVDVEMNAIQVLASARGGRGGAWGRDDTIVFQAATSSRPLERVAATGGPTVPFGSLLGRFPSFLPDGVHFLYYAFTGGSAVPSHGVYVADLDGSPERHLLDADGAAVYASGHLLFVRGTTLLAQRFDPSTLAVSGSPFPIASGVNVNEPFRIAALSASLAGPVVFRTGTTGGLRQFVWVDRAGRELGKVGEPVTNPLSPTLSPDGSLLAFHRTVAGNTDIWLLETGRGVLNRLTVEPTNEFDPAFSPDGSRVAFASGGDVCERLLAGGGSRRLFHVPEVPFGIEWSPDGRYFLYSTGESSTSDLLVSPADGSGPATAFAATAYYEVDGKFSPDGRWIAYTSDESGEPQVYVGRFPGSGHELQVSTAGGGMARWRRDSGELYYVALDGKLMAVPLRAAAGGGALQALAAVPLFDARVGPPVQANSGPQYVAAPDGQRFLLNQIADEVAPPITVVVNWKPES